MIRSTIIGASGYAGAELLRILSLRNDISVEKVVAGAAAGKKVEDLYPVFAGRVDLEFESFESNHFDEIDVAFVALPSGEAMKVVPHLLQSAKRVIDLSGDFRLASAELYEQFYKHSHVAPELLSQAVYGLPELNHDLIAKAALVANPGCYPTSAILALLPALMSNVVSSRGIVINSLSGVSGAGRSASVELSYTEVNENIRAYKINNHQHVPEIQSILEKVTGQTLTFSFIPHLVPLNRGIYTTIHADLTSSATEKDIMGIYRTFYGKAPFVRIKQQVPQIKDVVYTNYCDIGIAIEKRTNKLVIISVIDNLVKGAAGQAVQNMNIMFGLPQEQGLL
jgi:N-acetyl-gamma-glutamyl-phosphate reductase